MITFAQIQNFGRPIEKTTYYTYYRLADIPDRYDSNYLQCHTMPTNDQFQSLYMLLQEKAKQYDQNHAKFVFPANEQLPQLLKQQLLDEQFTISFLHLYSIQPSHFKGSICVNKALQVKQVDATLIDSYLLELYYEDVEWGEDYALAKMAYFRKLLMAGEMQAVVALLNGEIVGGACIYETAQTVEMDAFYVLESYQKQGIGSAIQQFVMQLAGERRVILVADGEDTAKDMYERQGYQYHGIQYAALKTAVLQAE